VSSRRRLESGEDLVALYLEEIGRYPLLTKDDEVRLARRIEAGSAARAMVNGGGPDAARRRELEQTVRDGEAATQAFVKANLRLVVSIARKYQSRGCRCSISCKRAISGSSTR
jgi:DNA-directed RNA polymerase sigma subunit (sigma70/sigma32)